MYSELKSIGLLVGVIINRTAVGALILTALIRLLAVPAQAQPVLESVIYSFTNSDVNTGPAGNGPNGGNPYGSLVFGTDNALYGTTSLGGVTNNYGPNGNGIVFEVNPDGSGYQILHRFTNSPDGGNPFGA